MSELAAQLDETSASATPTPSNPINGKPAVVRIKRYSSRRQQQKDKKRTPLADLTNATSSSSPRLHLEEREPDPKSALPPPSIPPATSVRGAEGEHGGTSVVPTSPQGVKESFLGPGELSSVFPLNYLEDTRYPALRCRNALLVFSMNVLESMPVRLLVLSVSVEITVNPFRQCHSVVLFLTGG